MTVSEKKKDYNRPHILLAHHYFEQNVKPGDIVVDATLGNGHDIFYLARLLQGQGRLVGYDIQVQAIENTKKKLEMLSFEERSIISLKLLSHTQFEETNVKLFVYNLGYLPGGNKKITTTRESTLQSLESALLRVMKGGAISIMCYPGHPEGAKEQEMVLNFLKGLPSNQWSICYHEWVNRPLSPSLIWLTRLSSPAVRALDA